MAFPEQRMRRLRAHEGLRRMVRETRLDAASLVMPLFVRPGKGVALPIPAMPGQFQLSTDRLVARCREIAPLGIGGVLLFGIPDRKDALGSRAYADDGIVPESVRLVKRALPGLVVITDVCLCGYTDHGHCGVIKNPKSQIPNPQSVTGPIIDNDATLELLAKMALAHARAGADMAAPSDMMDGRVAAIRAALDREGFTDLPIMSYAAKYASSLYAPFREAAGSAPQSGDRRSYQMDHANADEALREAALDIGEGADIVMVKPALACGDVIRRVKDAFGIPVAAYNVSGEYAMVKAAAEKGWLDERAVVMELLTGIRRAGADIIVTYWAADAAQWIKTVVG
ncbi:MAG: porphobilinogen synthase [Chlamydiota bacterium]